MAVAESDQQSLIRLELMLELSGRNNGLDPSTFELQHTIGHGNHVFSMVRAEDHRQTLASKLMKEVEQLGPTTRIKICGRFVQKQHPRCADQRQGQREALAHAARECADWFVEVISKTKLFDRAFIRVFWATLQRGD